MVFDKKFSSTVISFIRSNPDESNWGAFIAEAIKYTFLRSNSDFLDELETEYQSNPLLVSLIYNAINQNSQNWQKNLLKSFGEYIDKYYPTINFLNPIGNWRRGNNRQLKAIVSWFYKQIHSPENLDCEGCENVMIPSFLKTGRYCCFNENCEFHLIPIYDNHCHSCLEDVSSKYDAECGNCSWIICGKCGKCADPRYETCKSQIRVEPKINLKQIREHTFDSVPSFNSKLIENIYNYAINSFQVIHKSNIEDINCGRGKDVITSESQLNNYLAMYLPMHVSKLYQIFTDSNFNDFKEVNTTVIDWGCGQGIGTISLLEYLHSKEIYLPIKRIILIEPSKIAINKANEYIMESGYPNMDKIEMIFINKDINDISTIDFEHVMTNCINIFSNILDVESIDIALLSNNYSKIMSQNILNFCVCPYYSNAISNIDAFINGIEDREIKMLSSINSLFTIKQHDLYMKKLRGMRRTQYSKSFSTN